MDRDPQPKPRSDSENDAVYTLSISPGDALQFEVFPDGWAELRLSNPKRSRVAAAFFDSQRGAYVVLRIWRVGWEEEEEMYPRPPGPKPSTRIVSFAFPGAEPTVTTTHDHVHVHLGSGPGFAASPTPTTTSTSTAPTQPPAEMIVPPPEAGSSGTSAIRTATTSISPADAS